MLARFHHRFWNPSALRAFRAVLLFGTAVTLVALGVQGASAADDDWEIEGGGWGHGIGLSQYGAYGMALDGFTADEILAHYYSGAETVGIGDLLGADHWVRQDEALWIGLEQDALSIEIEAVNGALSVCQTGDGTDECDVSDIVILPDADPAVAWRFEVVPESNPVQCRFVEGISGTLMPAGDCWADVTWDDNTDLSDPTADPALSNLAVVGGRSYAHGTIRMRPNNPEPFPVDGFHVSLSIGLEDYIYGIGEVPSSWHVEALAAQATIARSFAVATAIARSADGTLSDHPGGRQQTCWCHLDTTSSDQNFVGWTKESEGTDAVWGRVWISAVDATTGFVATHPATPGAIISTYYSSSTGGATENNEDVWGGTPLPYTRSVDDHWAIEPEVNNGFATWTKTVSRSSMLAALAEGWDAVISARMLEGPPGTVVEFTGSLGDAKVTTTRTGNWFRAEFSVRSPYVSAVIAPGTVPPFTDIGESIHYDSIAYIWQEGITKGCNPPANDRFCPTNSVTRGQMAAFLNRALDLPAATEDFFVDDGDSIFEGDINRLAATGITQGCNPPTNDRFCPDDKVTRGQMAAFLVRAFGYTDAGDGDLFTDDDDSIFEGDIDRLGTAGITRGCNPPANTRFCPDHVLSREEMATFLYRALR